jgi:DNA-binding transcriptional MerR regulator
MNYSIGSFAAITNLSIYTLRYYENEELIVPGRKANGQRYYSEADISWIQFIKRLKATGMPIKEIQKYAKLRSQGDLTMSQRMQILVEHRAILQDRIADLQDNLMKLDDKINYYKSKI